MKQISKKLFILMALGMALLLATCLVACNDDGKRADKAGNEIVEACISEDFLDHWLGFVSEKSAEEAGLILEAVADPSSYKADYIWGAKVALDLYYHMDGENAPQEFYVLYFSDEKSASEFDKSEIFGDDPYLDVHQTVKGNVVYLETVEGYIEDVIFKTELKESAISKKKHDFIYSSLNEVKNEKYIYFDYDTYEFESDTYDTYEVRADLEGNIEAYYSILNVEDNEEFIEDMDEMIESGLYTGYVDFTREEGYVYAKLVDKPGFKYAFIKDDEGNDTDAIAVFGYCYDLLKDANFVIPSYIDGHPVEEVTATCIDYYDYGDPASLDTFHLFSNPFKSVKFPKTMKRFGNYDLHFSDSIEKIEVEEGNPYFHVKNNCLIETATGKLYWACKGFVIPDYVKEIGYQAFAGCNITSIDIPVSVERIDLSAFYTVKVLNYKGTTDQFKEIEWWNGYMTTFTINCTNGTLTLENGKII